MKSLFRPKKMNDYELRLWCIKQTAGLGTKFRLEEAQKLYRFMTSANPLAKLEESEK
jgi:hypothetical protein